jgi:hypothetical protein
MVKSSPVFEWSLTGLGCVERRHVLFELIQPCTVIIAIEPRGPEALLLKDMPECSRRPSSTDNVVNGKELRDTGANFRVKLLQEAILL